MMIKFLRPPLYPSPRPPNSAHQLPVRALEGLYWMAPICTLWMWGLACFVEVPKAAFLRSAVRTASINWPSIWGEYEGPWSRGG